MALAISAPDSKGATRLRGWRVVALAGLIVGAAILMFWAIVTPGERAARPDGFGAYPAIEFAALDEQDRQILRGEPLLARHEYSYEYVSRVTDRAAVSAIYEGSFDARSARQHSLFLSRRSDLLEVRLNGAVMTPDVRAPRLNGSFVAEPALFQFPASLVKPSENRFTIKIRRSLRGPFIFPDFALGSGSELAKAHTFRHLMSVEISIIGIVIMAFTALLALVVVWPEQDRTRNLWFVAMLATSSLVSTTFMFSGADKYETLWMIVTSLCVVGLSLSSLLYVMHDIVHSAIINRRNMALSVIILTFAAFWITVANYVGIAERYHLFIFMITRFAIIKHGNDDF